MDINSILMPVATLGGMGLLFGLGLGFAAIKLKVEEDPKLLLVKEALPGANCGGCGFAGCEALAGAIVKGEAGVNACPVGGASVAEAISEIMGVSAQGTEKQVAFVKCNGSNERAEAQYEYYGINDCAMAGQLAGNGPKSCAYGCVGYGNCERACMFDAISIKDGIAVVDKEKCVACGMCVTACPKALIELIPEANETMVCCNSGDTGKVTRGNCTVGCIGCKMCEKACNFDAIHVEGNLAKIDYAKCTMCNECVKKCPTKAILEFHS